HDLGSRSPFPRIDLILCRNVLIYFTPELQRRALQLFAFSLRSGGYLALGKAETVSPLPKYFAVEQPHLKIYRRINTPSPMPVPSALDTGHAARIPSPLSNRQAVGGQLVAQSVSPRVEETAQSQRAALLLESIPLGIITVSRHYDIRSLNIAARTLLNLHSASAGDDLIHRLPPAVAQPLRAALDATFHGEPQTLRLRCDDDVLESGGRNLEILCYPPADSALVDASAILVISDVTASAQHDAGSDAEREQLRAGLERETTRATRMAAELGDLQRANTTMATNLAQLRADNELLRVAHEEDQAAAEEIETLNEEAQATNEELETLNEEARATVEELSTANDELQARGFELRTLATAREMERARWEAVLSGIGDAVLVVDENERLLQTNDAFREMFGPDLPFAPKDEDGNVLPANARPQARAARGEGFETTFSLTGPDGARRWYEAKGQPIRPGEPGGVVAIRDITDRSLRRLQDQWLAIASHELRTPLTTLQVLLQLAQRRREDDERMGPLLDQAREQVRRLGALITVLVDAERLRGDGLHFIRQRVDLGALVDGAVETARHLARGQTIALTKPTTPFWVDGDGNRLEQVLLNLLTNAITYAPGTSQIEVRLQRKGADAMIEVRDYGPGIPAADLERIFARYHHVDQGVTNGFAGLGLGLFIAREIVVAHGGVIDARSTMGEGAVFTICLPLARDEIANPAPVRVAKPARGKSKSPAG
nr:PAS domain-containing protein [Chloroflexia bacterium]